MSRAAGIVRSQLSKGTLVNRHPPSRLSVSRACRVAVFVGAAMVSAAALADELPVLTPGMWEFKRTVEAQGTGGKPMNVANRECTDPTAEMRKSNDMLAKQGCTFTPVSKSGATYTFSSDCRIQGVRYQSRSVITVESASAYRVDVTSSGSGPSTKEVLVAKRTGDCKP